MKKKLSLLMLLILLMSLGGHPIITHASFMSQGDINAFLVVSEDNSQPQTIKVFSVEELNDYINEYHYGHNPSFFDRNRYDESFFEDKFLYFSSEVALALYPPLEITSVRETINAIEVEITRPTSPRSPDMSAWFLVLEMDLELVGKDVNIILTVVSPAESHGTGWHFDPTSGTLTISTDEGTTAWRSEGGNNFQPSDVKTIVIYGGVTAIGAYAFANIPTLASVTFQSPAPPYIVNAFDNVSPGARAIVPPSWEENGIYEGQIWRGLTIEFRTEPLVTGPVPEIVRNIIVNIWGSNGLLYNSGIAKVAIPPILFEMVDTPNWENWFWENHSWQTTEILGNFRYRRARDVWHKRG
jgi:hypothetical protein